MISDHYDKKWDEEYKKIIQQPHPGTLYPPTTIMPIDTSGMAPIFTQISRTEFENLKKQVEEMRELLTKALAYDRMTNQAECSNEEKLDRLEKVAKFVGIDCDDLFKELRKVHAKKPRKRRRKTTRKTLPNL
jgi:hypothetical protein